VRPNVCHAASHKNRAQLSFRHLLNSIASVLDFDQIAGARTGLELRCRGLSDSAPMLLPLLGYFFCMIAVLTAAVGVTLGLSNISTSERARHYPRPVVERNVKATNAEPRLFMVVPEADRSSVKNVEANSAAVPTEKADAKKSKPHKPKVLARRRNNYERPGYYGNAPGYAEASRNGPQRLFSNWW
jgi:hypothetical protein